MKRPNNLKYGGKQTGGPVAPKYPRLQPQQMQEWNSYLDYVKEAGYEGSEELNKRDKNLGQALFNQYKAKNPNATIDYSLVPSVQQEMQMLAQSTRAFAERRGDTTLANSYNNISGVDGWFGSKTSQYRFPSAIKAEYREGELYASQNEGLVGGAGIQGIGNAMGTRRINLPDPPKPKNIPAGVTPELVQDSNGSKRWAYMNNDGDLKYLQKGGSAKPPIYTNKKNDPRIRAYNDSMNIYNADQKYQSAENKWALAELDLWMQDGARDYGKYLNNQPGIWRDFRNRRDKELDELGRLTFEESRKSSVPNEPEEDIKGYGFKAYRNKNKGFDIRMDTIRAGFKRPVQPVIYRPDPEVRRPNMSGRPSNIPTESVNIDTTPMQPNVSAPSIGVEQWDLSKKTPYSFTRPTGDNRTQESIYFPDQKSLDVFNRGARGVSSQSGQGWGTSTGYYRRGGRMQDGGVPPYDQIKWNQMMLPNRPFGNFNEPLQESDVIPGVNAPIPDIETPDTVDRKGIWQGYVNSDIRRGYGSNPDLTPATPKNWAMPLGVGMGALRSLGSEIAGRVARARQNQYDYDQQSALGMMEPMPTDDYQPTYNNMYAKMGGLKHHKFFGPKFSNGVTFKFSENEKYDKLVVNRRIIPDLLNLRRRGR